MTRSVSLPVPTEHQLRWQDYEMGMFCHFGMNTFCSQEWGEGTDSPELFHPTGLDARQWVRTAKQAGFRYFVLTAKHHDGFCLWPTATTDYSVASSPWKNGKGDVVRECADACKEEGIGFGLYLSPWDRHEPCYSNKPAYDQFYLQQLEELLTGYGSLVELWFDGAGSEGREYDWPSIISMVKQHHPEAMIFNMGAPTIRWVGNEDGLAPYPCWNTAESAKISMFSDQSLQWLPETPQWVPAECDVPIREGRWFWRSGEEDRILSLESLMDIYYRSIGHGATLLLNVAPDNRGLMPEADMERVLAFGEEVRRRFAKPIAETHGEGDEVVLELEGATLIDHIIAMEDIRYGERIRQYVLEGRYGDEWKELSQGTAIGHKRIDRIAPVCVDAIRLRITESAANPVIRQLAVYCCE
ncbi:alpha-L-fucosidase [Paenibacillus sp. J5C_2022]|uniref:alpha-L-fucosidase n=1 Tax=Paenibacillus sp. J5C2022 TaxID=2977129 RepID=UPI0021D1FF19|nr:alpha-L-fucosidase [Paenibacillus sp. J5C2022]MCU6712700.1 alpha-L-fucosidase [Paenibacillus sp. J5C2022]